MFNGRVSKDKNPQIISRDEAQRILGEYAADVLKLKLAEGELEAEINALRAKKEKDFAALRKSKLDKAAALEVWASYNRAEFGDKKSLDLLHGQIGFQLGKRALKARSGLTWEKVLLRVKDGWEKYVRNKPELNKEQILTDAGKDVLSVADLTSMGVKVVQEESFFITLKQL